MDADIAAKKSINLSGPLRLCVSALKNGVKLKKFMTGSRLIYCLAPSSFLDTQG
jgi:hypothetical protein